MPYHVIIKRLKDIHDQVELDFTDASLHENIVTPFNKGKKFTCNGTIIDPNTIERIQIKQTDNYSNDILPQFIEQEKKSSVAVVGISNEWRVANCGKDVTRQFIKKIPAVLHEQNKSNLGGSNITIGTMTNSHIQQSSPNSTQHVSSDSKRSKKDDKLKGYAAGITFLLVAAIFIYVAFQINSSRGLIIIFAISFAILGVASLFKPLSVGQIGDRILQNISRAK